MSNKSSYYFNQISKKGLLENDKKLLLNKFGFKNLHLSQANLNLDNNGSTINYSLIENSLASIKNDNRKPIKACSIINLNINSNNNPKKIIQIKNKTNQSNIRNNQNKTCPKNVRTKYNQSLASLSTNGLIFLNEKNEMILYKSKNNISSVNVTDTTAQNSMKTNIGLLPNTETIKPIKKRKSKIKNDTKTKNCSSPNLFEKASNSINLNKEKPFKVFNNSSYLSKTNKKINTKKIMNNRNNDKLNKYNVSLEKKINKTVQNFYTNKKDVKNNIYTLENTDKNINKTNEKEIKNNSEYNNSDNTKKESIKELHKIFDEKIMQNIDKKNNKINNIIANNLEINQNNKNNSRNNNNQQNININEQITINIENNMESFHQESNKQIELNNKNILIPHTDTHSELEKVNKDISKKNSSQIKNNNENQKSNSNKDNNIQNYSNYESILEEKEEKVAINNIRENGENNFKIFNENYDKDNEKENDANQYINENDNDNKSKDSSSIKTHENLYKHLNDLDENDDILKQDEQEHQPDIDDQSERTQTTLDKNYILSKFIKQPIYDISSRFLNEETINTKNILPTKKFLFIDDIENKIKDMPVINLKKMLNLNNECLFNLISYSYDNYSNIISIHNLVKKKVEKSLKAKFQHAINDFRHKYGSFLNALDFTFNQKKFNLNNKKNNSLNILNLEIKCEIITQEINKSYEIGCNYISNKKNYDYFWKFDVLSKSDIKIWICTELNKINNVYKKFTYTSQVSSFCYKDIIKFQFNIFSKDNIIDPKSIEWTEPVISIVPGGIYEKSKFISKYSFDQIRACEVETQILFWKNQLPEDDDNIVNKVKRIYGKLFDIQNIRYDVSKFYFFKIEMKAKKIGLLKQNEFSDFDINIVDNQVHLENEIQCIYLMNSYYYTKKMDVRIGTNIILYIVDMKR